jgi:glycerol-3-phosphate dehydrogenase (NAD(P)+)
MQQLRPFLNQNSDLFERKNLVTCCKGIDLETGQGPVEIIRGKYPDASASMLTGPSFAKDIAAGKPTALTLACKEDNVGTHLQSLLTTPNLRLYRTIDTLGAELGGALKNVIAIAAGIAIGARLGDSARAAVITRGFAEMQRFALARGARPETLAGLSGFGDLVLTCTSEQSRNFRYGRALGAGAAFDQSITVEGSTTARAVAKLSRDLPITNAVIDVMDARSDVLSVMQSLLDRPLKEE